MITEDNSQFPNNIVELVALRTKLLDSDLEVFKRPIRPTDPNQCVGVLGSNWVPRDDSKEMLGQTFAVQPTLSTYSCTVQALIRDTEEARGLNVHGVLSRMIRSMIYTDNPLRVALSQLSSTLNGRTEVSQRWGVTQQRFFVNEISGEWLYMSILELWLETEIR